MTEQSILECDIGNSRCKWRLLKGEVVVQRGDFHHQQGFDQLPTSSAIKRVRVSCVADDIVLNALAGHLENLQLQLEIAVPTATLGNVRNAYKDPSKLGVDRWLALVAAYKRKLGAVLVIDAGSALTVDLVGHDGNHLGGYIVPGIQLMKSSLLKETGGVRFDESECLDGVAFGCSTLDAVNGGVRSALTGSVMVALHEAECRVGKNFSVLFTGGDAELLVEGLADQIAGRVEIVPELVLDGLQWVLP
jgi:type III pantothenate kinase